MDILKSGVNNGKSLKVYLLDRNQKKHIDKFLIPQRKSLGAMLPAGNRKATGCDAEADFTSCMLDSLFLLLTLGDISHIIVP